MGYRLGIDLGTAFTAAAFIEDAEPRMLELGRRQVSVPSVLLVTEDGTLLIGEAAERRAATEPDRVIREFKRRFGDQVPLVVSGHSFSPVELQTEVLRWVLDHAEQRLPPMREHTVVTHPAGWGPYKLQCMRDMLAEAGIAGATLCPEPVAAAIEFAATRRVPDGAKLVIYDLGGGTFDVAVVEKSDTGFGILGTPLGVDHLGGADFDEALFAGTLERLGAQDLDLDPDDPDVARGLIALRRECIEAKEALSTDVSTQISSLLPGAVRAVQISRREFEELIRPALDESVETTGRALRLAGVEAADLHAVVLVGGSSRIPLVTELLTHEIGAPVVLDTYPKNTIALGAARHARVTGPSMVPPPGGTPVPAPGPVRGGLPRRPPATPPPPPPGQPPPPAQPPARPPNEAPSTPIGAGAGPVSTSPVGDQQDQRRRPRWVLPVALITGLGVLVTVAVFVIGSRAPQTGVLASPFIETTTTTSVSPLIPSVPASPSIPVSPTTPTPPPADPSFPTGPAIPQNVVMVPMRTTKDSDERRQLHLIDTTGANSTVVLKSEEGKFANPTVQPSRTTILLRRGDRLWVMSSKGKQGRYLERRQAGGCRRVVGVSWSQTEPDVLVIACGIGETNRQQLLVINTKGRLIRKLDTGKRRIGDDVTISPDGRKVLYWSTEADHGDGGTLYTVNVDGTGKPKRITTGAKGRDGDPAWSPDGRQIAFRRVPLKGSDDSDVYVMNSDGTGQRKIDDTGADDMKPVWSPDGARLIIVSNRRSAARAGGKNWRLWLVDVNHGKVMKPVGPSAPEITTPTWLYR